MDNYSGGDQEVKWLVDKHGVRDLIRNSFHPKRIIWR